MILTRLAADQSPPPTRFAADVQEQYGDTDRGLIEAALEQVNELIVKASRSFVLYPDHRELQRSFAKLVNRREELEQRLLSCS